MKKLLSGVIILLIISQVLVLPTFAAGDWINIEDKEPVKDYAYAFVAVGDTQVLCYNDAVKGTNYMSRIYDWIIENKEEKKIEYVFGLGDITDASLVREWEIAVETIRKLDGVVPYSMVRGNHDQEFKFFRAFCDDAYAGQFEGFCDGFTVFNTWRTFSVCGDDYLMITLDHGPTDDELAWASGIIERYPEHRVIITTHWYLASDGMAGDVKDYGSAKPIIDNHGTEIWDKLIKKHGNIFMIMSGHYSSRDIVVKQRVNPAGNKVTQVLIDPQGYDASVEHAGMIGIFYFSEDGKTIDVEYFSPIKNQYFKEKNQLTINIPKGFINEKPKETTVVTEVTTTEAPVTTPLPTESGAATTAEEKQSGCKGALPTVIAVPALMSMVAVSIVRKKKRED